MQSIQSKFTGITASRGIAIGKAYFLDRGRVVPVKTHMDEDAIESEVRRFKGAIKKSSEDIKSMRTRASGVLGEKHLYLFDTHMLLLEDDLLIEDTVRVIRHEKVNAEWAFHLSVEKCIGLFIKTENEYLRERKNDIEQIKNAVLLNLLGWEQENLANIKEPVIIIARDIQPADLVQMDRNKILGFITEAGGKTSHVGIMASALEIPAVVGLPLDEIEVKSGDAIIVDGYSGKVFVNPMPETFKDFLEKQQKIKYYAERLLENISFPSETKDGVRVKLMANIEYSDSIAAIRNYGAEGVGLFRTEYLFMNRDGYPDEEEQFNEYKKVAEILNPDPITIRTLDVGGDKQTGSSSLENEKNPALGLRAIRYSFKNRDIFKTQLRAILRAGCHGKIKIMFPMISGLEELRDAKSILNEAKTELKERGYPFDEDISIGIMIETPSSAMIADLLAKEVNFFSIGTNDLIQYALAVDRGNKNVANLYKPLHPAVLRMIRDTIREANRAGIEVGVCGEMGGNMLHAMVILGMGQVDEMSMDSHSIPKIKRLVRSVTLQEARELSEEVMSLGTASEIEKIVYEKMKKKFPDNFVEDNFPDPLN